MPSQNHPYAQINQVIARTLTLLVAGVLCFPVSAQQGAFPVAMPAAFSAAQGASQTAADTKPGPIAATLPGLAGSQTSLPKLTERPDTAAADARPQPVPAQFVRKPQTASQFQRFVQESTGRLLPHFGAELFNNPQTYAADSAAPAPAEYVLGQGDEVRIQIWGSVEYAGNHTIDRNGQINLPKIGTVKLNGLQLKDLEAHLRKHIGQVLNNFTVNASLGKLRGITVYVVGQAQQPGTYNLSSLSTLVNALFISGGPNASGSMRSIQLKRGGKIVTTFDLYDFIGQGDKSKDAALQPGDVIVIPPAGPRVALTGATDLGAIYEIKTGNTLQDILSLGGGVPALASVQKALLESIDPSQPGAPRQIKNRVLDAQGLSQPLNDGDIVTLLSISPAFGNAVTLQGTVAQPIRNAWFNGMRILDLIPNREALITPDYYRRKNQLVQNTTEIMVGEDSTAKEFRAGSSINERVRSMVDQINWDYAVIERLSATDLRTELIPFNLGKALLQKDPAHNLLLNAGDVITIMGSNDLRLPNERKTRLVRVEGEVAAPGIYQTQPGETLRQLIARIGGITPQAYLYGIEFTREAVRKQQQTNLDQVIRRLESQAQSANLTLTANLTAERVAQATALQQQQQAQQRAQIDKLKAMRSQGRVSLELDASTLGEVIWEQGITQPRSSSQWGQQQMSALPNLPLEDGDAILVPSLPAFVSATGSVNSENVMIYKAGRTVGQVIKAAGLTEDADARETFVLRADGSVLSRRSADFFIDFDSTKLMPGDTVIVPTKVDRESGYNFLVRALRDWTQIFSNLGIGAAAIKTLRN